MSIWCFSDDLNKMHLNFRLLNWENYKTGQAGCLEGAATSSISEENTPIFQGSR